MSLLKAHPPLSFQYIHLPVCKLPVRVYWVRDMPSLLSEHYDIYLSIFKTSDQRLLWFTSICSVWFDALPSNQQF